MALSSNKRYQVFISSTYEDLKEERLEVLQALLELDCIPCGMEYFPAASESQWKYITQLIDDCDYYMVIIGNRYGSEDSDGKSYTQKEYEYACSRGIPVIGFLHHKPESLPVNKSDHDDSARKKLIMFRKLIQTRLCKYWENPKDLGGVVSRSMVQEMRRNPRIGWVRANELDALPSSDEMLKLITENKKLKEQIDKFSEIKPSSIKDLSNEGDELQLSFIYQVEEEPGGNSSEYKHIDEGKKAVEITWDSVFLLLGAEIERRNSILNMDDKEMNVVSVDYYLDNERDPEQNNSYSIFRHTIKNKLHEALCSIIGIALKNKYNYDKYIVGVGLTSPSMSQIFNQFRALGLTTPIDFVNRVSLTPKGELKFSKMTALKKGDKSFLTPAEMLEVITNKMIKNV